jgi:hypothetical protein
VWRRTSQILSWAAESSIRGEQCGRLERSSRPSPANQRCHHLWAVAGETLKVRAALRIELPRWIE